MNDRRRRFELLALVLILIVFGSLIGTWRATAQGTYAPVTDADVGALKLNHYFSADRKSHEPDFEWSFTKSDFVIKKGAGKIPSDLLSKLLGDWDAADEIRGKWKLTEGKGPKELVFTEIKVGAQFGMKEARLPIYRTAPTVIRIGEPQYVFARDPAGPAAGKETEKPTSHVELRSWIVATGMSWPESKHRIHWVSLVVDADQKGEGRGTLVLNPNPPGFDEYGDLVTGWETKQFDTQRQTLPLIEFECRLDYVKSGAVERVNDAPVTRQIYRLSGPKIKSKLSIATTGPGLTSGRLLVHDAKGRVESVVELSEIKPVDADVPQIPCHPGCFPAATRVRVAERSVAIETLRVGDEVTSIDAEGHAAPRKIESIFTTKNRLLELKTDRGRLFTTRTQPVSLAGGGFRTAGDLQPGDRIWHWCEDQRQIAVVAEVAPTDREEQVFNLVIGESAVFIAGDFLVRGKPPAEQGLPARARQQ